MKSNEIPVISGIAQVLGRLIFFFLYIYIYK